MTTFRITSNHPQRGYEITFKDGRVFLFDTIEECLEMVK